MVEVGRCCGIDAVFDEHAVLDSKDTVRTISDALVVRNRDQREPLRLQFLKECEDISAGAGIEIACRLIREDHRRPCHESTRDRDTLALAA